MSSFNYKGLQCLAALDFALWVKFRSTRHAATGVCFPWVFVCQLHWRCLLGRRTNRIAQTKKVRCNSFLHCGPPMLAFRVDQKRCELFGLTFYVTGLKLQWIICWSIAPWPVTFLEDHAGCSIKAHVFRVDHQLASYVGFLSYSTTSE